MRYYSKVINGETVVKPADEIKIQFNGFIIATPSEEQIKDDGWVLYSQTEEDIALDVLEAQRKKIKEVVSYDSSDFVNVFFINNTPMWLDKSIRASLRMRFESEMNDGYHETILWNGDVPYPLLLEDAIKMLHAIEIYASKCYDTTQNHIRQIRQLTNIEDVESYNYKVGYPSVLVF